MSTQKVKNKTIMVGEIRCPKCGGSNMSDKFEFIESIRSGGNLIKPFTITEQETPRILTCDDCLSKNVNAGVSIRFNSHQDFERYAMLGIWMKNHTLFSELCDQKVELYHNLHMLENDIKKSGRANWDACETEMRAAVDHKYYAYLCRNRMNDIAVVVVGR